MIDRGIDVLEEDESNDQRHGVVEAKACIEFFGIHELSKQE